MLPWVYQNTRRIPILRHEFPLQPTPTKAVTFKQIRVRSLKAKATASFYSLPFDFDISTDRRPVLVGLIHVEWDYKIADNVLDCKDASLTKKLP